MDIKDILMGILHVSPLIALMVYVIVVEIKLTDKPSCYKRTVDNKNKLDKKFIQEYKICGNIYRNWIFRRVVKYEQII